MTTPSPALIELVDSEILAATASGDLIASPGYALLDNSGIITGNEARQQAWLYPQRSFNHYWHQLNLAPLTANNKHARHHGDLAFAQLARLHQQLDTPEELLFALPGSFSRDQLSILLGLANALPATTKGLVDSAVAIVSTLPVEGDVIYIDLQLHQAVITHLVVDDKVRRIRVETLRDAGIKGFYSAIAQQLADLFIREYRFDPLHNAAGEQQLYDQLPNWLEQIQSRGEALIEFASERGNFRLGFNRQQLNDAMASRINHLHQHIARLPSLSARFSSYRLDRLPGLTQALGTETLQRQTVFEGCREIINNPFYSEQGIGFITELPRQAGSTNTFIKIQQDQELPSHLLLDHRAYPLTGAVYIDENGMADSNKASLKILKKNSKVILEGNLSNLQISGDRHNLLAGDRISVANRTFTLVRVMD